MKKLKAKIKIIPSLPPTHNETKKINKIIIKILIILIIIILLYITYLSITPYINSVNINEITGKKIHITNCNTKDYIIIGKDKSYSMKLTNNDCISKNYEGNIIIKNNEIIFNDNIKGIIDNNYNIIINNNIFERENNDE